MPSGASSPGPGAGRVMGPDCVPTLLRVSRVTGQNCPQCPELLRVVSSPCRPRIDTQEAQSCTVHKCPPGPQPPTPCLLPRAVRNAGSQGADLEDPMGGRIEAALRPRFRRGPWEAHPKRGPRALLPATGQPQGHLLLGDSLSHRSSSGAAQYGPSGCSPLPQLWGLGHPRQPWCPGPQQDPQKPVGPVGSTFRCVHSLPLPAVTLSLSARGTGPRAGQRFRAALTKLLSWEWATHQTSGPALVSPGRWLDTAGHPSNLFSVWQCLALPPPPDRKALKPQASSGDSCSLSLTAKLLPAWLPALPHPTHRPGGPQRVLAESRTVLPRGRVPSTPSLVHHPGTLHGAWAGATVGCRPRCSP